MAHGGRQRTMKYTNVFVAPSINVSSSGHYFATVFYTDNGAHRRFRRDYCLGDGFLARTSQYGNWKAPVYLEREVCRQLREWMLGGKAVYFEYDCDGNERTTELRYYDAEYALTLAARLYETTRKPSR